MKGSCDVAEARLSVQPALNLPTHGWGSRGLEWTQPDAAHPYWLIQRTGKNSNEADAEMFQQDMTHAMACAVRAVTSAAAPGPSCNRHVLCDSAMHCQHEDNIYGGEGCDLETESRRFPGGNMLQQTRTPSTISTSRRSCIQQRGLNTKGLRKGGRNPRWWSDPRWLWQWSEPRWWAVAACPSLESSTVVAFFGMRSIHVC